MQYGLFGKLPARRDFISQAVPRTFLRLWEPWLEQGIVEGRNRLGASEWEAAFRAAPIWRFWLGADLCGTAILGAFMPSMDAVGRYFPLTLIGFQEDKPVVSPNNDPQHALFEKIEMVLLSALEPGTTFEKLLVELDDLNHSGPFDETGVSTAAAEIKFGTQLEDRPPLSLVELFAVRRLAYQDCGIAAATFWWTAGGAHFKPVGLMRRHLPETGLFTGMLTGHLTRRGEEKIAIGVKPS